MPSNTELLQKADIALSDLATAGLLSPEQNTRFFRVIMNSPTIFQAARFVTMGSPTMWINKMGFGSRILHKAVESTALDSSKRPKPDLSKIEMSTKEVIATVYLPYALFEDNIEGGNPFVPIGSSAGGVTDTIIDMIGERAALDLEEMALLGDTTSGDEDLAMFDGWMKRCASHIVDADGAPLDKGIFKSSVKAMPDAYLRDRAVLRHFVSVDQETEYRDSIASRGTALGDATLQGISPVYAFGSQVIGASMMPNAKTLFTNPLNLIFGIQRRLTLEYTKDIEARVFKIVLTARVAVQVETIDAAVQVINLAT